MRGVPLKAIQELLGHATIEMTMRYAHLAPVVHRQAVAELDRPTPVEDGHQRGGRAIEASQAVGTVREKVVEAPGVEPLSSGTTKPKRDADLPAVFLASRR